MTEYIIFTCSKCKQYSYVKTSQKTKKCLRCGRNHLVKNVLTSGFIVNGITKALEVVKQKQNELAIKDYKGELNLRSENDFVLKNELKNKRFSKNKVLNYEEMFKKLLIEIKKSSIYKAKKGVPEYYLDMVSKEHNISLETLKSLKNTFLKNNSLQFSNNSIYINL